MICIKIDADGWM